MVDGGGIGGGGWAGDQAPSSSVIVVYPASSVTWLLELASTSIQF